MADRRPWDAPETFEGLVGGTCCPAPGDVLLAIAAEFRPVDAARVSFRLDEIARWA
jgi:hypothetical protein